MTRALAVSLRCFTIWPYYFLVGLCLLFAVSGCSNNEIDSSPDSVGIPPRHLPDSFRELTPNCFASELPPIEFAAAGKPLFEKMENSGLHFINELKRENHTKLIETGSGVAVADYDLDGIPDVYLASTDGPNKLFRGKGNFEFEDVTHLAKVDGSIDGQDGWSSGASFVDVDNDGDYDLYVCNMSSPNLLYINQGNGTFEEQATSRGIDYCGASKVGSFCDYDQDGDLDLFLLTNQDEPMPPKARIMEVQGELVVEPGYEEVYGLIGGKVVEAGERDYLFQNDGKGHFVDVSNSAGIHGFDFGLSATWFDYDNDNWLDLYVANDFKGSDKLYRNNRDGTFTDVIGETVNQTPWFSMGSAAGDLNNDGLEDLMVADMAGDNHYKQKVNMGNMSDSGWFLVFGHPRQFMRNMLFINSGLGKFLETAFISGVESTNWTWSVKIADLDNDGMQDVFVTNGHARDTMNSDLTNKAKWENLPPDSQATKERKLDLPPILESNIAFKNIGSLNFDDVSSQWGLDLNGISHGAALADLDCDGDLDIVVNNLKAEATVYRNNSDSSNRLRVELRGESSNRFGFGAKVEIWNGEKYQMRRLTPVTGYLSSDEPLMHFGVASWEKIDRMLITWPNGKTQELQDLPLNNLYRIYEKQNDSIAKHIESKSEFETLFNDATSHSGLTFENQEAEFDDFVREPLLPSKLSRLGPGVAWGDVNNDGYADVFIGGPALQSGKLYLNRNGKFENKSGPWDENFLKEDMGAVFFDFEGDGDQDLYVVSGGNQHAPGNDVYKDSLYLNDGAGNFEDVSDQVLPGNYDSGSSVSAADFDRDGDIDLFVCSRSIPGKYPLSPKQRLLLNDQGRLIDRTTEVSNSLQDVGMVNSATWSDINNDGWVDLILAIDWGPVRIFQNKQGNLIDSTQQAGLSDILGWWKGIACGDVDNDGDIDFVATNQGLNTKYHCSRDKPHRIYFNDFDGNGTLDLVEAEYEGNTEFPIRGRSCSSRCMPFVAEKFETFHDFALASLDEIYEIENEDAERLEVNELRTCMFINDGTGKFSVRPLPWLAQISPSFGVALSDFNLDGLLDVIISQNFFGAQPETGYMDGGLSLLLLGTGNGELEAVWPSDSGIAVSDDAMTLTLTDFDSDGDEDLMFLSNRGSINLYRNEVSSPRTLIDIQNADGDPFAGLCRFEFTGSNKRVFDNSAETGYLGNSVRTLSLPKDWIDTNSKISVTWPDGTEQEVDCSEQKDSILIRKNTGRVRK